MFNFVSFVDGSSSRNENPHGAEGKSMKGALVSGLILAFIVTPLYGEPKTQCHIREISQHDTLVTFSWELSVYSERRHKACVVMISFRDGEGEELFAITETLDFKQGTNAFEGLEVCQREDWEQVKKYVTEVNCMFE
jgi:hypothetical protein